MKLIDIVKKLPWPDGAVVATQDYDGELAWSSISNVWFHAHLDVWLAGFNDAWIDCVFVDLADDYREAVITKDDWLAAQEQVVAKEREPGFYWVRLVGSLDWIVCEYVDGNYWMSSTCGEPMMEHCFLEIDERRIVRQP